MPEKVEKRREFLINILFLAVILALVYVFFKYLFWVTAPFVLTFLMAIMLQNPLRKLDKKFGKKFHTFWSIILILLVIAVILIPLGFLLSAVFDRIGNMIKGVVEQIRDLPTFLAALETKVLNLGKFLPDAVYASYKDTITELFSKMIKDSSLEAVGIDGNLIKNGITTGISGVYGFVKNIPGVLIGIVIGVIAWVFFTKDYDRVVRFIQLQLPEGKKNILVEIKQVFNKTVLKMFRAYGLILLITFGELFLGFSILSLAGIMKNAYFVWIAAGIAIFDILPIAGSGGVLIPWSLISLIMGNIPLAVGLIVIYIIITLIRQYIEPKIVGTSLGVHPLITLMGLYFGLKLFGFLGMFIVPITVMTLKAFNDTGRIHLWTPPQRN